LKIVTGLILKSRAVALISQCRCVTSRLRIATSRSGLCFCAGIAVFPSNAVGEPIQPRPPKGRE
jgi:hypothetical protein